MTGVFAWSTFYNNFINLEEHSFGYCICQINHSFACSPSACHVANLNLRLIYNQIHRNYVQYKQYLASQNMVTICFHCKCCKSSQSIADIVQNPQC